MTVARCCAWSIAFSRCHFSWPLPVPHAYRPLRRGGHGAAGRHLTYEPTPFHLPGRRLCGPVRHARHVAIAAPSLPPCAHSPLISTAASARAQTLAATTTATTGRQGQTRRQAPHTSTPMTELGPGSLHPTGLLRCDCCETPTSPFYLLFDEHSAPSNSPGRRSPSAAVPLAAHAHHTHRLTADCASLRRRAAAGAHRHDIETLLPHGCRSRTGFLLAH